MEKEHATFLKKLIGVPVKQEQDETATKEAVVDTMPVASEKHEGVDAITWEAPEAEYIERSTTWYWGSMAIAIILIAIALWQKNFLFAVFIVIAELSVFMLSGEKPVVWGFVIDDRGVTIEGHKTYKYKDITRYDIHKFSDTYNELVLQTKSKVHHYIKIFIHVGDEKKIREALDKKVAYGEIEVSSLEFLERLIGF